MKFLWHVLAKSVWVFIFAKMGLLYDFKVYGGSSCERLGGLSRLDFCMKWI